MYLQTLDLKGLKLLADFRLSLPLRDGRPQPWTVLLAENGCCKTTVLQAIAALALGPARASSLVNVASYPDLRSNRTDREVWLNAQFRFGPVGDAQGWRRYPRYHRSEPSQPAMLFSELELQRRWTSFKGTSYYQDLKDTTDLLTWPDEVLGEVRRENLPHWFVAGYGVSRYVIDEKTAVVPREPAVDRCRTLFGEGRLVGLEFYDLLAKRDPALAEAFLARVDEALVQRGGLLPGVGALLGRGKAETNTRLANAHRFTWRSGAEEIAVPATWLSQGYQGTISWIADLIGQVFWEAEADVALDQMEGLVLVDELDLHLHPRWQRDLVPALRAIFPAFQFIVTTHSPALLASFEAAEIRVLRRDDQGSVICETTEVDPRSLTGSELYQAFFGVPNLHASGLAQKRRRYGMLASDPGRSPDLEAELHAIRAELSQAGLDPGWDPVPVDPDLVDPA